MRFRKAEDVFLEYAFDVASSRGRSRVDSVSASLGSRLLATVASRALVRKELIDFGISEVDY